MTVDARHDYRRQAATYDRTRAASPSILAPVREALTGAPGSTLLDVGGGTGNYAAALLRHGWQPHVVDVAAAMLAHAAAKGLPVVRADATRLPVRSASIDAVTLISMLHLVAGWQATLCRHPELLLNPAWRAQTSFFERLGHDDPDELAAGLARLRSDMEAGHRPDLGVEPLRARLGDGAVIAWVNPEGGATKRASRTHRGRHRIAAELTREATLPMSTTGPCASYARCPHWARYQPFLPAAVRLTDAGGVREERWEWDGIDVHLDRYPAYGNVKVIVLHGGGGYGRLLSPLGVACVREGF